MKVLSLGIVLLAVRGAVGGRGDRVQVQERDAGDQQQPGPEDGQVQVPGQRPLQLTVWRRGVLCEEKINGQSEKVFFSGVASVHKEADQA